MTRHETPAEYITRLAWPRQWTVDTVCQTAAELRGAARAADVLGHDQTAEELRAAGTRLWDDYQAHRAATAGRTAA